MLRTTKPADLTDNVFKLISTDWMLITAGPTTNFNTMTASWGGLGHLWGRDVCWCVVRPARYTYEFLESNDAFTLSFFEEAYRPALNLLGSKSGRDGDKVAESGLTPVPGAIAGTTTFAEARVVMAARKLYFHDIDPSHFLDPRIDENYPTKDYHRLYVGEILNLSVAQA